MRSVPSIDLAQLGGKLSFLRLCLVDGSTFLLGRTRHSGRQSEHHFETILFSRGRGVGEFSLFDALCLSGLTVKC